MYKNLIEKIKEANEVVNIGLFTHKNPDYDAVCSTLTLANYLKEELKDKVNIYPILDKYDHLKLNINSILPSYDTVDTKLDYAIVLDVNEKDLVYKYNLFDSVNIENRYIFDHHMGNREPLNILETNKLIRNDASSTCEVLATLFLKDNLIDEQNAYNLYLGISADTVGFNIGLKANTISISNELNIDNQAKEVIINEVSGITKSQEELFKRIEKTENPVENLTIFKLILNSLEEEKVKELYSIPFEEIITPKDLDTISFLLVECGNTVFYKLRKHENSTLDIVELAKNCNGGGHSNRCAGRLVGMNYDKALDYITSQYKLLNKKNEVIKMIFATNNKGKLQEIKDILKEYQITGLKENGIDIDVEENGKTFYENALIKAKYIYELTKIPTLADDSGLCIDKFNNWPGVMTHRFLGDNKTDKERNNAIIDKMKNLSKEDRKASVVCSLVYYDGINTIEATGQIDGFISEEIRGEFGFGFDPIFELPNQKTLAELTEEEKNEVSARALAAKQLKKIL